MNLIQQHIDQIANLCKMYQVKELYAFGSVVDEKLFSATSDVDLMIKFDDNVAVEDYADLYFDLADDLEKLFRRKVGLLTMTPIRNRFLRENIEATRQLVYAA